MAGILLMQLKLLEAGRRANGTKGLPCFMSHPGPDQMGEQKIAGKQSLPCPDMPPTMRQNHCQLLLTSDSLHATCATAAGGKDLHGMLCCVPQDLTQQCNGRWILSLTQAIGNLMAEKG